MRYKDYTVQDFLKDEKFKSWVISATLESDLYWSSFTKNHPESIVKIKIAKEILMSVKPESRHGKLEKRDMEEVFERILRAENKDDSKSKHPVLFNNRILKIAAAVFICISFALFSVIMKTRNAVVHEVLWQVKASPKGGATQTFEMPDHTMVTLGPNSTLKYERLLNGAERKVWLSGEAFFQVTKDARRPFIVYTEEIYTTVLGTSFSVSAFRDSKTIDIALISGEVLVQDAHGTVSQYLSPSEKLVYHKLSFKILKTELDYAHDIEWKDNVLVLKNETAESLKRKLENWYGVKVTLDLKDEEYQLYGRFKNKSLEEVLEAISYAAGIDYQLLDKEVILTTRK